MQRAAMEFHVSLEANILAIRDELQNGTYEWGKYRAFYVNEPKRRLIEAAPFRDRVVHHAIHEVLEPLYDPSFYYHSYACRTGRGTHAAVSTLRRWIGKRPALYFLKMDVKSFFASINREVLFSILQCRIGDMRLLALIKTLIMNAPGTVGIPIGNLTSQLFANVYLDRLDQFVKRVLRVPYFLRYMDDVLFFSDSREQLVRWRQEIEEFGREQLKLRFHPHKTLIGAARDGISFVGYRTYPWGISVRGRSLRRFRKRLLAGAPLGTKIKRLNSYFGHIGLVSNRLKSKGHAGGRDDLKEILVRAAFERVVPRLPVVDAVMEMFNKSFKNSLQKKGGSGID